MPRQFEIEAAANAILLELDNSAFMSPRTIEKAAQIAHCALKAAEEARRANGRRLAKLAIDE
jgi:hypothetical protein